MGEREDVAVLDNYDVPTKADPLFERRHSDSDEYLSPLETTMNSRRSGGRRSESRPRSRSRRSRDDYDSDLLYRDSEVSHEKEHTYLPSTNGAVKQDFTPEMKSVLSLWDRPRKRGHFDNGESAVYLDTLVGLT